MSIKASKTLFFLQCGNCFFVLNSNYPSVGRGEQEALSCEHVLVEYNFEASADAEQQVVLASQRILNGDSKVYKFLAKWSCSGGQPQPNSNLMLKILVRQAYETGASSEHNVSGCFYLRNVDFCWELRKSIKGGLRFLSIHNEYISESY